MLTAHEKHRCYVPVNSKTAHPSPGNPRTVGNLTQMRLARWGIWLSCQNVCQDDLTRFRRVIVRWVSTAKRKNWVGRVIFSGFIRFERRSLRKSVCSLVFLLAVETHRTITLRHRVRSSWAAGKQQKIQHSNRVSRFYSQNISRIDFSAKPLRSHTNFINSNLPTVATPHLLYAARRE